MAKVHVKLFGHIDETLYNVDRVDIHTDPEPRPEDSVLGRWRTVHINRDNKRPGITFDGHGAIELELIEEVQ